MSELQPILVPIRQASAIIGKCRRSVYNLIAADQLQAVKSGRNTLVVYQSLKEYAASLPAAKFRAPHNKPLKPRPRPRIGRESPVKNSEAIEPSP
jgi:hypothetical protein